MLLPKTERDSGAKSIIARMVEDANNTAYAYILESSKHVVAIGKIIKDLVDDEVKQKPELITNWKELERYSETPLHDMSVSLYKKIYLFTSLIKTALVPNE